MDPKLKSTPTPLGGPVVYIPGEDILAVAAEYIRRRKISQLEDMSDLEILLGRNVD